MEPVLRRNVVLRDGDEARKAGLRREEIVRRRIQPPGARIVADGEQPARLVVEEREVHVPRNRAGARANDGHPAGQRGRFLGELLAGRRERDQVAREVAGIDGRDIRGIEHAQVMQLVPVHQVSPHLRHGIDRIECPFEAIEHLRGRDEPEVVRRNGAQQLKADVRR